MFGIVEDKIKQAVSEKEREIGKLKKEKKNIVSKKNDLESLVDNYIEIEDSIKGVFVTLIIGILIVLAINSFTIPLWISVLSLTLVSMSFLGEIANIKELKKILSMSDNIAKKEELLLEISELEEKLNKMHNKINVKKNTIMEYNKMTSDINKLKEYVISLGNDENEIEKACNFFYRKPQLVFDTDKEYNIYLKSNSDEIKKEMIVSKVLANRNK